MASDWSIEWMTEQLHSKIYLFVLAYIYLFYSEFESSCQTLQVFGKRSLKVNESSILSVILQIVHYVRQMSDSQSNP